MSAAARPLRVAEIISARRINGAAKLCLDTASALAERGHAVTLFHRPELDAAAHVSPRVACIASPMRVSLGDLRRMARAARQRGIEVTHSHTTDAQKYGALLRRFWRIPSVATAHNSHGFDVHWRSHDRVIALSEFSAAFYRRINRVPPGRLVVIPNFIAMPTPPADAARQRAAMRDRLGVPRDAFLVGSIGEIDTRKRQSVLVGAFARFAAARADAHLALVGAASNAGEQRRSEAAAEAVAGRVHFAGFVPGAGALMPAFDIFALSSRFETLPLSIMEAMAHGLPVVSTRVGGVPDLVADGVTGLLVREGDIRALADALARLAAEDSLRGTMGEAGRHAAARFAEGPVIDAVEAVLRDAAGPARDG
jgi:glycosyltransferase involved in cell wall biosynthesis